MTTLTSLLDHLLDGEVLDSTEIARVTGKSLPIVESWRSQVAVPHHDVEERLLELRAVVDLTARVMTNDAARSWMRSPNPDLRYQKPLDLVAEGQYERVIDLLLSLAEGMTG